jgi:hypothetical protein
MSQKIHPNDDCELDYQFPSQSFLDNLMENDPQALAKLQLKAISNDAYIRWIFTLNDGQSSILIDNNNEMEEHCLDFGEKRIAKVVMNRHTRMDLDLAELIFLDKDEKELKAIGRHFDTPTTVELEEDEVIIGFKARLNPGHKFLFSNFQLMICKADRK